MDKRACIMAEQNLAIPVSELKTIRLVCLRAGCGGSVEFPSNRLTGLVGGHRLCPSCNLPFNISNIAGGGVGGLHGLGLALQNLGGPGAVAAAGAGPGGPGVPAEFRVEFVIPAPE
jgi:hypothetical protein